MMQILEKLPGITVERCSLLDRSLTFSGQDLPTRNRPPPRRLAASAQPPVNDMAKKRAPAAQNLLNAHSVPAQKTTATEQSLLVAAAEKPVRRAMDVVRPVSRDYKQRGAYQSRPTSRRTSKPDIEVSGNAALIRNVPALSVSPAPPENNEDIFPQEPAPMPKSILKRAGSGTSNRSSRSLGVMSLDSGMAKLTASLIQRGKMQEAAAIHKIATKYASDSLPANNGRRENRRHSPELENLPQLGASFRRGKRTETENSRTNRAGSASRNDPTRLVTVSPSKSVTFKLDPEVSRENRAAAAARLGQGGRGGAKWSVSLSQNQEHLRATNLVPTAVPEFTVKRSNPKSRESRVKLPLDHCFTNAGLSEDGHDPMTREEHRKFVLNSYSSSALLRPRADGGITGVSGIHLMADPYRRYLMARAANEAKRFSVESKKKTSDRHNNNAYREVSHAGSLTDDTSRDMNKQKPVASGLDRTYAFLPSPIYHHMPAPLPTVKRRGR